MCVRARRVRLCTRARVCGFLSMFIVSNDMGSYFVIVMRYAGHQMMGLVEYGMQEIHKIHHAYAYHDLQML